MEYEQIEIYNITNGERLSTYAILAEEGSGTISLNGAAAHRGSPGDTIIICSYVNLDEKELAAYQPTLVYLDENNHIKDRRHSISKQVA